MTASALALLTTLGHLLVGASLVGALVGLGLLPVRKPLRRLPPAVQAWLWWLVAARLLLELAGAPALELAWLPAAQSQATVATVVEASAIASDAQVERAANGGDLAVDLQRDSTSSQPHLRRIELWGLGSGAWLLAVAIGLGSSTVRWRRLRSLVENSRPDEDRAVRETLAEVREALGLKRRIVVLRCADIATPLVVGWMRPRVLLPRGAGSDSEELRLILLHELEHVRRLDALRAWVPELTRRLLFFHPLAQLAAREFGLATEAACDEAVVRRGVAPPERYGALIARFATGGRCDARLATALSFTGPSIHRRLEMLARDPMPRPWIVSAALPMVIAVPLLATPLRLVAPSPKEPPESTAPTPPSAAAAAAGARWIREASPAGAPTPPEAPAPASAPAPATVPAPPSPPEPLMRTREMSGFGGADWVVLVDGRSQLAVAASAADRRRAESLNRREGRPILLIGRAGRTWVVRDPITVESLRILLAEQIDATERQMTQATEMARLAAEQVREESERSLRMAMEVGERQALETRELEAMARRQAGRGLDAEAERLVELTKRLAEMRESPPAGSRESLRPAAESEKLAQVQLQRIAEELAALEERQERRLDDSSLRELQARQAEMAARLSERLEELEKQQLEHRDEFTRQRRVLQQGLESELERILDEGLAQPFGGDPGGRP